MSKYALVIVGVVCIALSVAMADVTQTFVTTADTGMDGSGLHHTRGADSQIRVGKGNFNSGEMGAYQFNTTAIKSFINSNLGGESLVNAIAEGKIAVSFSVVCSDDAGGNTAHQVGVSDVFTNNSIIEGPGPASPMGPGDDDPYNWTNSGYGLNDIAPYAQATTMDSPADYYGAVMGGGDGTWYNTERGWYGQQFKNLSGTMNLGQYGTTGGVLTNWVVNQRNSVQLDDNLWAEYIYGLDNLTGAPSPYATTMLKTYGLDNYDPSEVNLNVCVYTKEYAAGAYAPELTVTVVPEPASLSLLALGGLAMLRGKK
jgi:hypothetical protein